MQEVAGADPGRRLPRLATFEALAAPNYRAFWIGLVFYVIGYRAEQLTAAWLVWELTHDPLALGYLGLAQGVPYISLQILGSVVADRSDRLRVLAAVQLLTALTLTAALIVTVTGAVRFEHLLLLSILSSSFRAFDEPSRHALVPSLVERERLPNAIALGSVPWQTGRILGPSIAGLLIWLFGGAVGYGLAAAGAYCTLVLYSRIRVGSKGALEAGQSFLGNMLEGFAFVFRNSLFASLIGLTFFNSLFGTSYVTLLPIFADSYLNAGSAGFGLLQGASGLGAVVGTLTIASLTHRLRHRGLILLGGAASFGTLLIIFSQAPSIEPALAALAVGGLFSTTYLTLVNTILQEKVPDNLRGRVMGTYALCFNLVPIGGMLGGLLAHAVDARFAVMLGGAMVAVTALLLLASSQRLRAVA